ncbi:MAG: ArsC family reductase [Proteobacteria bacterium]|nr:ArsC family reductase [Pseudomonadota bacterium]
MNTILYGIPNCDTVKKARAWLAERGVEVVFHDYKKQGVPEAELRAWVKALGWETLLNRKGTTWRKLDAPRQAAVTDAASAIALMLEQPSVIRRPVLLRGEALRVGFDADDWAALFA